MEKMRRTLLIAVCLVVSVALAVFSGSMCTVEGANPQHGAISICFDDGKRNQFDNAFQLMKARGIVGTFYIITDGIRDFSGNEAYMSVAELQTLQAYGNEIGSHTKTHAALAGLYSSTIREECYASKQLLQSYGLTVNNIAYPYGSTDSTVDAIASEYYRSGRYAYTTEFIMYFPISQFTLFAQAGETDDASELPRLKSMVDQVYSANGWGAIFFHNVIPDASGHSIAISTQDFAAFLDYVVSKGVSTITVNQALEVGSSPATTPLTVTANCGTVSPASGHYAVGEKILIRAEPPQASPNERYIWNGWTGSGSGSYSGYNNPATITMNGPVSQVASWRHEFKLTISTNLGTCIPPVGEDWYDVGSQVYLEAFSPAALDGERYIWLGWTGTGSGSYSGSGNLTAVVMNGPVTQVASWRHEFRLTISSNSGITTPSGGEHWFAAGNFVDIGASVPTATNGERYMWGWWTGVGSGSYSGPNPSASLVMNGPVVETASWIHQFQVTIGVSGVDSDFSGGVITVDGASYSKDTPFWWDAGTSHSFEFGSDLTNGAGKRYVWRSTSGLSSGQSGFIVASTAGHLTANFNTQFQVTVDVSGVDSDFSSRVVKIDEDHYGPVGASFWWDYGSSHNFEFRSYMDDGAGKRYVWISSSGLLSEQSGIVVVSGPGALTGSYKTQFLVDVFSDHGVVEGGGWYDAGSSATVSLDRRVANESPKVRFIFRGWSSHASGDGLTSDPMIVNAPLSVVALWKKQFLVGFNQSGLPDDFNVSVIIDSENHSLPFSDWVDEGDLVQFVYPNQLQTWFGVRYVLSATFNQSSVEVDSFKTITAQYTIQYTSELIGVSTLPAAIAASIGLVRWRRRRRRQS